MAGNLTTGTLEFDLGQKWAKGAQIKFFNAQESEALKNSPEFAQSYSLKQIHSNKVISWNPGTSTSVYKETEADGFIVRGNAFKLSKKKILIRTADCAPLFFVDRETECLASIHAGWPGLAKEIHKVPFREGFNPKTTWIWCGPCLNGESFEVGEDMWSQFPKEIQRDQSIFAPAGNANKRYFYMWKFLEVEFKKIGVELFYNVEIDTFSTPEFNSYRRWKKAGESGPLPHNYSSIQFL
jgi:YfiH family protein